MVVKKEIYGYAGKILRVHLGNGEIWTEPTEKYAREWLGGAGLATAILYNEVKPWVTAYEPANRLILGVGTLVGTLAPGACRMDGTSINPFTNGFGSCSTDSYLGGQLKYAGYDAIVFQGKAHGPVYLWIEDDDVQIRDASHLWGKTTWETFDLMRQKLGSDLHTLSIGPAGENLVRGACIIQDKARALGRCGLGAVMGSKNLKAVTARGTGAIKIADPERFMKAVDSARESLKTPFADSFRRGGTAGGALAGKQHFCILPYKNFQDLTIPEEMLAKIDQFKLNDEYKVRNNSFPGCCVDCGRFFRVTKGPYAGYEGEGFQLEAVLNLNTKLAVDDPTFTIKANAYCNQLGLDIDLPGGAIPWAFECYQRGILKPEDCDGLQLEWGDTEVILELIRKIAYREGFGDILAEGAARAAEIIGRDSAYYAMHIKTMDIYEVLRGAVGWALGVTTSTRGGGHTTGSPVIETYIVTDPKLPEKAKEVFGIDTANDALAYEGKAKLVEFFEGIHRVNNSLGICHFNTIWTSPWHPGFPEWAEMYSAATGWETSADDLIRITRKQLNLEKSFNLLRTNLDRKDDYPTARALNEPIPSGKAAGWKIERKDWDKLLDEYYERHGWDKKTSFPTRKTLEGLGMKAVADDLEKVGKLGHT